MCWLTNWPTVTPPPSPLNEVFLNPKVPSLGKLELVPILDKFEAVFDYTTNEGRKFVIQTDLDAPMFKLIVVDLDKIGRASLYAGSNLFFGNRN